MTKSRLTLSLAVLAALFAVAAPASAQLTANGFSFGTTFVNDKTVDQGGRIRLELFGFFSDGSGAALIDVICPISGEVEKVCGAIDIGDELSASSGTPPVSDSDDPNHYRLRSIQVGTPVVASLNGASGSESGRIDARSFSRERLSGEIRSVVVS